MRVVRLLNEPDWQSRLSPIEEIFFTNYSRASQNIFGFLKAPGYYLFAWAHSK